jgi:hypothetical protein
MHKSREMFNDLILGDEGVRGAEIHQRLQHYMRTVLDLSKVCMNGPTSSKTVAQVQQMQNDGATIHTHREH